MPEAFVRPKGYVMKALKEISAGSILVHVVFFYGCYCILAPLFGSVQRFIHSL